MRHLFVLILVVCLSAGQAWAQTPQDRVVEQLFQQGYTSIQINRTWLGRVRIIALNDEARREIVLNPRTGEILRDYWFLLGGPLKDQGAIINYGNQSGGNKKNADYDDDRYDDDRSDNSGPGGGSDDDRDNSGSGSSNSGSGSDNSGSGSGGGSDDD